MSQDDDRMNQQNMLSSLLGILPHVRGTMRSDEDYSAVELARRSKREVDTLCEAILTERRKLKDIDNKLADTFSDVEAVHNALSHELGSISFFPNVHHAVSTSLSSLIGKYLRTAEVYELNVKGKIRGPYPSSQADQEEDVFDDLMGIQQREARAAKGVVDIIQDTTQVFIDVRTKLPEILQGLREIFVNYDRYLRDRFVKSDEKPEQGKMDIMALMQGEQPQSRAKYVKIELIDGNPVLTDLLLVLADAVPDYNERTIFNEKDKKAKTTKTISKHAVEKAAEMMAALSDPKLLAYIKTPSRYFVDIGTAVGDFYDITQRLDSAHKAILEMPQAVFIEPGQLQRLLRNNGSRTQREIERIKSIDLDSIIQDKDDVLPDNKKENDYFLQRSKLLSSLNEGMEHLSAIDDPYQRFEEAKQVITGVVDNKYEMKQVLMTGQRRKLRRDRQLDNEYYVGRQHGHGQFRFERKPAPDTKMKSVIGASFDRAKNHLREIIDTAEVGRVMSTSAPGGKVRSNILLIGPYGCGKTELARAACGDKRVIGASVSVANTLTAYMHESVGNVKRVYDQATELRTEARDQKPVMLVLDEFNGWFANGSEGANTNTDMQQIENVFLEVLDGMEDYNGIITLAMTNKPMDIPAGIMRRFRYVDIVGQLTTEERAGMLEMYLARRMPLHQDVPLHYQAWAERLQDAPGDVVRKVVDEIHFELIPKFIANYPAAAKRMEQVLYQRENKAGIVTDRDIDYVKSRLQQYGVIVTPDHVNNALDNLLKQPAIQRQIDAAKTVYRDAERILEDLDLASSGGRPFGLQSRSKLFDRK